MGTQGRARSLLLLGILITVLGGCGYRTNVQEVANREAMKEILAFRNEVRAEMSLLERHNTFLSEKVDKIEEKIAEVTETDRVVGRDLEYYLRRPEEVKEEVLLMLEERAELLVVGQESFREQFEQKVDRRESQLQNKSRTEFAEMQQVLDEYREFLQYVYSDQDSVNAVFAGRFDTKPWFQSIIGRWEESGTDGSVP